MNPLHDLPNPTYWPMFFALGMTAIAWGLITTWILVGVGILILLISTIGWVKEVSK